MPPRHHSPEASVPEAISGTGNPTPPDDRLGLEVLDTLANAVLLRLDRVLAERIEALRTPADEPPEPVWLRVTEVARRVGASERTVYRALRSGALAGERLGAHWRVRPESVEAWLAAPRPQRPPPVGRPPRAPAAGRQRGSAPQPSTFTERARQRQKPRARPGPATNRPDGAPKEER